MNAQSIIPPNIDYGKISADKYSPDDTYEAGDLRIQYNSLWKAKQAISVPEPWTPAHWDPTTLAAEFSALNSSLGSLKFSCFQTQITFSQSGDGNIQSGRNDWEFYIPIVTVSEASISEIIATPNGNQIYLYSNGLTNQTVDINVLCVGK